MSQNDLADIGLWVGTEEQAMEEDCWSERAGFVVGEEHSVTS